VSTGSLKDGVWLGTKNLREDEVAVLVADLELNCGDFASVFFVSPGRDRPDGAERHARLGRPLASHVLWTSESWVHAAWNSRHSPASTA
jgi:hypothetical protein